MTSATAIENQTRNGTKRERFRYRVMAHCARRNRFHGKSSPHEQTHDEVREKTATFCKPAPGRTPEGALSMFAPIILASSKTASTAPLPECVLYFVSDPSCRFSTRKPSVFLSAGTREFDLWRCTGLESILQVGTFSG